MKLLIKNKDDVRTISSQDYDVVIESLGEGKYELKAVPNHTNTNTCDVITLGVYSHLEEATVALSSRGYVGWR